MTQICTNPFFCNGRKEVLEGRTVEVDLKLNGKVQLCCYMQAVWA